MFLMPEVHFPTNLEHLMLDTEENTEMLLRELRDRRSALEGDDEEETGE